MERRRKRHNSPAEEGLRLTGGFPTKQTIKSDFIADDAIKNN